MSCIARHIGPKTESDIDIGTYEKLREATKDGSSYRPTLRTSALTYKDYRSAQSVHEWKIRFIEDMHNASQGAGVIFVPETDTAAAVLALEKDLQGAIVGRKLELSSQDAGNEHRLHALREKASGSLSETRQAVRRGWGKVKPSGKASTSTPDETCEESPIEHWIDSQLNWRYSAAMTFGPSTSEAPESTPTAPEYWKGCEASGFSVSQLDNYVHIYRRVKGEYERSTRSGEGTRDET